MNNKFIKVLIIINGLLLPIFVAVILFQSFSNFSPDYNYESPDAPIVGDKLEQAILDTLALQGLSYETPPQEIYNSTNMYIPLSVNTYEMAKKMRKTSESAGDFNPGWFNHFNILFLDKDYKVIGQLIDKKATISEININNGRYSYNSQTVDETVKHIAYRIGFIDTDKNDKLDYLDEQDLYISDLNGQNLTQVTSKINIADYEFINSNTQIFIRYKERNNLRDEHNPLKFAIYDIVTKNFKELKEIEEKLKEIERKLIK